MSDISIEIVKSTYINEDALRVQPYKVYRFGYGEGRVYYTMPDEKTVNVYSSLTTALNQSNPLAQPLLEWYCKLGYDEAKRFSKMKAHYGTMLHQLIGEVAISMECNLDKAHMQQIVEDYTSKHNYWQPECATWASTLQEDMVAWMQFAAKSKMRVLAVELCLVSDKMLYATQIDIVCKMFDDVKGNWGEVYKSGERKGEPKETYKEFEFTALINMKSGRHGFYRSQGIQLEAERRIFEENYPDIKIDKIYNWSPKEWNNYADDKESYQLKDWTGEVNEREFDAIMVLADERYRQKVMEKEFNQIYGQVYWNNYPTNCVKRVTMADILTFHAEQKLRNQILL